MRALAVGPVMAFLLSGTAGAASLDMKSINDAVFSTKGAKEAKGSRPATVKAQVLLDRANFSPGVIDGRNGENFRKAITAFEKANGLKEDGTLDGETWSKLATSTDPAMIEYTIAAEDVKGPFVEKIPAKMEDMAKLDRLGYGSPRELLAEKFHMDEDLLTALNPGKSFDKAGTAIVVANVRDEKPTAKVARIEVDKSEKMLRALAKDGKLVAAYPASVGSEEKPAPSGTHKVRAIAMNPTYTYNPDFKGVKAKEVFEIKGGPNSPVGAVWIDLSLETYGIHGTPEPAKVSKSYSHGCIRLTNWDAKELAQMVEKGTEVAFVE